MRVQINLTLLTDTNEVSEKLKNITYKIDAKKHPKKNEKKIGLNTRKIQGDKL